MASYRGFRRGRLCGFTLIELLVVISIIALLVSLLLPALSKVKDSENGLLDSTHQRGILQSEQIFVGDYGGIFGSSVTGSATSTTNGVVVADPGHRLMGGSGAGAASGYDYSYNPSCGNFIWGNVRTGTDSGNASQNAATGMGVLVDGSYLNLPLLFCPSKTAGYATPVAGNIYIYGTSSNTFPSMCRFWQFRQWMFGQPFSAANVFVSANTAWDGIISPDNNTNCNGYAGNDAGYGNSYYLSDYDYRSGDWSNTYTGTPGATKGAKLGYINTGANGGIGTADSSQNYLKTDAPGYTSKVRICDNSEAISGAATPHNGFTSIYYGIGDGSVKIQPMNGLQKDSAGIPYNYYPWNAIKSGSATVMAGDTTVTSAVNGKIKQRDKSKFTINWTQGTSIGGMDVLDNYVVNGVQ